MITFYSRKSTPGDPFMGPLDKLLQLKYRNTDGMSPRDKSDMKDEYLKVLRSFIWETKGDVFVEFFYFFFYIL